ncbi:MAG: hypothetical protein EOM24_10630, partial [Chloroflexia bacterium]|nr:hypothetical protein [Chloroflexia bacterium]
AGNSFFCVGVCLYCLGILGLVPWHWWLRNAAVLGIVFQVVFFSLGIADRMARCIQVRDGRIEEAGHA